MAQMIGHLDADCFYVSAERVRFPHLAGKPVGVLGNNGACVIARSYELKRLGVRVGVPIWDAVKLCPEAVFIKRDFRWYEVLSREMLMTLRDHSPLVEYSSIDEFFFGYRGGDPRAEAKFLRDEMKARVGVPVSVGVARSRTLAKLLSDTAKPFGAAALRGRDEEREFLAGVPVTEISGVARRRAARLEPYGIRTCLDLADAQRRVVRQLLTVTGEKLWRELNGEVAFPVQAKRPPHQTLSRGGSVGRATAAPPVIEAWLVRHVERLIEELEYHRVCPGKMRVWLCHADGPDGVGDVPIDPPTQEYGPLLGAARRGLGEAWRVGRRVSRVHVLTWQLWDAGRPLQRGLFDPPPDPRGKELARLKRDVNSRVGRFALRSAATLPLVELYRDCSHGYEICDVRGKVYF